MRSCTVICLAALLCSCIPNKLAIISSPEEYLGKLQTLELDNRNYGSYQMYHDTVLRLMITWLDQIDKIEHLRTVFWKCHSTWQTKPEAPQNQLQWIDPHVETLNLIMYNLAEKQSKEATELLIELYFDPKAGWDAGSAEVAGDAIVKCGKMALPYLKGRKEKEINTLRLIELIELGATTGL